jgi:hypothetical protein
MVLQVRTDEVDGFLLDRGFQIFLTSYPEARVRHIACDLLHSSCSFGGRGSGQSLAGRRRPRGVRGCMARALCPASHAAALATLHACSACELRSCFSYSLPC